MQALLKALDALYQPVSSAGFPAHLFAILHELLPGTAVSLDFVDFVRRRAESHVSADYLAPAQAAQIEAVVREFIWQNPVGAHFAQGCPTAVIQPTDLISQRQFQRTDLYQLAFLPSGMEYQIVAGLAWPQGYGGLVVNRPRARNFTLREVALVTRLRPHVERAYLALHQLAELRDRLAKAQESLAAEGQPVHAPGPLAAGLTRREEEVVHWVSEGKRNGEIGLILGISARTVEKHVENLFAKLGVETRAGLAAVAREVGRTRAEGPPRRPGSE